jgi:hypothetical protein
VGFDMADFFGQNFIGGLKMKKEVVILGLISSIYTQTFASGFGALSYAPKSMDRTMENENFKDLSYLKLKFGSIGYTQGLKRFGYYIDIAGALKDKDSKEYNEEIRGVEYRNYLLNIGTTWTLSDHVVFFGGIGADYQRLNYIDKEKEREIKITENFNGGVMFFYKGYGLTTGFDSVNKAMNFGFTYKY